MSQAATPEGQFSSGESAIVGRIVDPQRQGFSPEAVQSILSLDFASEDQDRMQCLAEKAREGSLTPDEQSEAEDYERVAHFLGVLHSKARVSLRQADQ
jgi:hypothetical protein